MPPRLSQSDRKTVLLISAFIVTLIVSWSVFGPYGLVKYARVQHELEKMRITNETLKKDNDSLRKEIIKIRTDPGYLAEVARKEFGLLKRNEVIYEFKSKKRRKK